MKAIILCSLVYVIFTIVGTEAAKLPKGFIQCRKSDPNIDECLRSAFQATVPHLVKGVPNMGIVPSDPYKITELEIDQGNNGAVGFKIKFRDLSVINLRTAVITKAHYDPVKHNLTLEIKNPNSLIFGGDYEASGKILILPITGQGKAKIVADISNYIGNAIMKPVVKKGTTYLEIVEIKWTFVPNKIHMKLDNLFNGNKELGDNMNIFLNENWREILKELQPAIEEVFGAIFKTIGQQFLNYVPENQLLLD
ncbi:Haemolymph juvenile hormone binding [Cinara cedri]|uniref:Haemolymph juvenile hormone binding n=1 Tax=Cinara cedri TaxID=506608 RepID=A0A5E4NCB8_9HEMI|nr:Haemolymph juvenile hormone binding [Cinara cedri]